MILPALGGLHVPKLRRQGRLHAPALHRDGAHRRRVAARAPRRRAAADRRGGRHRRARSRPRCTTCTASTSVHLDVKPSNILFRRDGRRGDACWSTSACRATTALPDLLEEEFELPMGTVALHVARAGAVRAQRPAQRPVLARRDALPPRDRRAPVPATPTSVRGLRQRLYQRPSAPRACAPTARRGCRRSSCAASRSPQRRHQSAGAARLRPAAPGPGGARRARRARRRGSAAGRRSGAGSPRCGSRGAAAVPSAAAGARSPIVLAAVDVAGGRAGAARGGARHRRSACCRPSPARASPAWP